MSTDQKVAVITGASQGIGEGLVTAYRKQGYAVVANSRSIKPSEDSDVLTVRGDIGNPDTAELVISQTLERFGRIDTLVNNAGIFIVKSFTDYTAEDYERIVSVNLTGFFTVTRGAISQMIEQGSGHVVTITTSLVNHANSQLPSALASLTKGGLDSATKALAVEYGRTGIRVNAVAPGIIKTPLHPVETHDTLDGMHPIGRMGEIVDVVQAVMFLESAPFVTGEIFHVDGGQSAGH
jgi:NAD(P)-dependent dehydrogenase (short-subunit alcohol dehydrogenase family)